MTKRNQVILSGIFGVLLVLVGFAGGVLWVWGQGENARFRPTPQAISAGLPSDFDLRLETQILERIKSRFVNGRTSDKDLFYGSLAGLVKSLGDPYSLFLDPQEAKDFNDELSGAFEGIGAEIGIKKQRVVIVAPLPDTPAERAGLKSGDIIFAIDGKNTLDMALDEAVHKIRGPAKTEVVLTIAREGEKNTRDVRIKRERIVLKSIHWRTLKPEEASGVKGKVALLTLVHFNDEVARRFSKVAQEIILSRPSALIVDLRGNPGGLLDVSLDVASHWVPRSKPILIEVLAGGKEVVHRSSGAASFERLKTIVLVNEGTASAAEILAGALSDQLDAKLVGTKTFGKGSVQDLESFPDGSSLRLTIAKWYTPKRRKIDGEGLEPDFVVERTEEDFEKGRDPQLTKALELLK